jgi:uncharacterized membrane protein YqjE
MKQHEFNPNKNISAALNRYAPDFNPFFETRLMSKIVQLKEESYNYLFNRAFQKVTMSGIAAVALLLFTIFISDGTISIDALVGTSNLDLESLTALTIIGH